MIALRRWRVDYVALYGFVRVTCFSLVVITWLLAFAAHYSGVSAWWPSATLAVGFVFFLAFIKFYRRFSLEVLMAIHALVLIRQWKDPLSGSRGEVEGVATPTFDLHDSTG